MILRKKCPNTDQKKLRIWTLFIQSESFYQKQKYKKWLLKLYYIILSYVNINCDCSFSDFDSDMTIL